MSEPQKTESLVKLVTSWALTSYLTK